MLTTDSASGDNRMVFLVVATLLAIFVLPEPWGWTAIGIGAVVEIGETIVWMWLLGRVPVQAGPETLIGSVARVVAPCRPNGEVRARGEMWRARCAAGADLGESVRVRARDGITLVVEPLPEPYPDDRAVSSAVRPGDL
jgi:membrane protein implicated in regulation of membrane protease activity